MGTILKVFLLTLACVVCGTEYKPINPSSDHNHDKWNTQPKDIIRQFRAYTVSFDCKDDSDNDGDEEENDKLGLPEWVAYQINRVDKRLPKSPKRPYPWIADKKLVVNNILPKDNTYKHSGFNRGHMCMKHIAWRLGRNADWNTHTTLNACPQLHRFNAGIWLDMEKLTQKWADKYNKVWVICGPVIYRDKNIKYIGDPGEKRIPVPHAFFKVVIREDRGKLNVLAFLYPHKAISSPYRHASYLVSVDKIEKLTGLDFLTLLPDDTENNLEKQVQIKVW